MAITEAVFRISGTVSFSDRSHAPFEIIHQKLGTVANPYPDDAAETFKRLYASMPSVISDTLDLLDDPGIVEGSLTFVAPATAKSVTDGTFFIGIDFTRDDNSRATLAVEYFDGAVTHTDDTTTVWTEFASELSSVFNETFELLSA